MKADQPVYTGPLPKTLERFRKDIVDISDERADGDGYWVYLRRGLQQSAKTQVHNVHEDTVTACARAFKWVRPCDCPDCAPVQQVRFVKPLADENPNEIYDVIEDRGERLLIAAASNRSWTIRPTLVVPKSDCEFVK